MRSDGVANRVDGVIDEYRVVPVARGIGDQQLQLRHGILEIVHDEGREAVVGVELAALGELFVGAPLRELYGDVAAHGLEQVEIFEGDGEGIGRRAQHEESQQLIADQQRRDQAPGALGIQPRRQFQVSVALRVRVVFAQVDDPLPIPSSRGRPWSCAIAVTCGKSVLFSGQAACR